jgi:cobalt-zinc-cadmium efflux system outer membrane protein
MSKHITYSCIIALLLTSATGLSQSSDSLNLADLVKEAIANNPQLRAARHRAAAMETRVDQVTAWEPPQVGVSFFHTPIQSFPNPFKNGTETDYYIQQTFPFPGKLSSMGEAAQNGAAMAGEEYTALEHAIVRKVKDACYLLYLVQRKIEVNAENQDLMRRFIAIASQQYEVGRGSQADILRGQTELSTLATDSVNLRKEETVAASMVNTLLNRPTDAPLGKVPEIETEIPHWSFDQLRPLALAHRPELKSMGYNLAMNQADLSGARKEYYPNLMVQVMYKDMAMTKNDFWSTMVGISIPIAPWAGGKVTAKVDEEELNVKQAREQVAATSNMTLFEVQDALAQVQSNHDVVLLYRRTVIPQAEQTLLSTQAAYQTGKEDFLTLIDAYRTFLKARLDGYTAIAQFMRSQAQLEEAVGLSVAEMKNALAG